MNLPKHIKFRTYIATIIILTVLFGASISYVLSQSQSGTFTISEGIYPGASSYTIWKEDSTYYAKNAYGVIDYSGTNASQVFNNAIGNGGNYILVRSGTYIFSAPIRLKEGTWLIGEGQHHDYGTILKLANNADCNLIEVTTSEKESYPAFSRVANMRLEGNKANNNAGTGIYVNVPAAEDFYRDVMLENLYILDFKEHGIFTTETWGWHIYNTVVEWNDGNGIWINSTIQNELHSRGASHGEILDSKIADNGLDGIKLFGQYSGSVLGVRIVNSEIFANHHYGIHVRGIGHVISNNLIKRNSKYNNYTYADVYIYIYSYNIVIEGNVIDGEDGENGYIAKYGINIDADCKNITISDNIILNHYVQEVKIDPSCVNIRTEGLGFEESGTATITSSTSVTFNHNLFGTPTAVWASFNDINYNGYIWTATSTQITITVGTSGTYTVYWHAEYKP